MTQPRPKFIPRPGQIDYTHAKRAPVVNCIVQHREKILIVKRSEELNFHPGKWNGISGFLDEPHKTVAEKVREELHEEAGIKADDIISIQEGHIIEEKDPNYEKTWIVHPILAKVMSDTVTLDWEAAEYKWIDPKTLYSFPFLPGFDLVVKEFFTI